MTIKIPVTPGRGRKKGGKNRPKEVILQEAALKQSNRKELESFDKTTKKWRSELTRALEALGTELEITPMERVAKAFYADEKAMVKVLKHLLPQLKAIELKGLEESPFKLIMQLGGVVTKDTDEDKDEND